MQQTNTGNRPVIGAGRGDNKNFNHMPQNASYLAFPIH